MKNKSLIIVILIMLFESLLYTFKNVLSTNIYIINTIFFSIMAIISYIRIGLLKYKKRTKIDSIQLIIIVCLLYLFINYSIGLFKGFNDNNINIVNTIYNIITLLSIEVIRYSLIKNISSKKRYLVSILFVLPLIIMFNLNIYLTISLLITSIMLTYISSNVGITPSIIYSIMICLLYLLPVKPNTSFLLETIMILISNILLFILLNNLYKKDLKNLNFITKKPSKILYLILIISISYIMLLLGIGNYKLIGIVSDSMKPVFDRGYAVIYKKINSNYYDKLKIGDILVYEKDNTLIVHRIIKKDNNLIITKGDNLLESDYDPVTKEQYIGVVRFYIPLIGYPNVWLSK